MKKKKILKTTLITFAGLLLLLALVVLFWLGPTIKLVAETLGPKALGTPVKIEKLSINPRKGIIHLSGFSIANHEDYAQSNTVSLASLDIAFDMGSIFSETVTVHQVQINSPHFVFEQSSASDNIAEYIQSIYDFIDFDPNAPADPKDEEKKQKKRRKKEKKRKQREEKPPKIVVVQSLKINDVQFHLIHTDNPQLDIMVGFDQLSVSTTNGIAQVKNLYVNNPASLSSHDLFSLDRILVTLDPATIYKPPLSILNVQVIQPHAFVEWAYDSSTVSEFLNIADSTQTHISDWPLPKKAPDTEKEEEKVDAAVEAESKPPPPEIHHIGISDFQLHLVNSVDTNLSIQVTLENLDVSLSEGTVEFGRFSVSNPRRLATPDLFNLEGVDIRFNPDSLSAPPLAISEVQVHRPYIFLENNPETDTVAELIKIADTITGSLPKNKPMAATPSEPAGPEAPVAPKDAAPETPPVELHHLVVDDIQVRLLDSTPTKPPAKPIMLAGIGEIAVELTDGKIRVNDMTIPNPAGFHATNLYHLAQIRIEIEPESIHSDQVVINEVFIDSPDVNLEQTKETGNVTELQKSLMAFVPSTPETAGPEPEEKPEPISTGDPVPLAEQPVVLHTLLVTNLHISAILLPPPTGTNGVPPSSAGGAIASLNPMKHIRKSGTTETERAELEPIKLIAYDLLMIKPLEGTVKVKNLQIGNPHGFANEHLVKLDSFGLCLDPDSLMTDTLIITNIHIHKPQVTYERQITTDNIKTFRETIEGAFAHREKVIEKAEDEYEAETDSEQKVMIEHLMVESGIVKAKIPALPTASIPLPTIEMKDIGKEEGGATPGEASSTIFTAFYDAIIGVVANTTGIAGDALKGAGSFTMDAFGSLGGLVGLDGKDDTKEEEPEDPEPEKEKKKRGLFRRRVFRR